MTNPYAPPRAYVRDIADPASLAAPADRGTRLGASILDGVIFMVMVYAPLMLAGVVGGATARAPLRDGGSNAMLAVGLLLALTGFVVWSWFTIIYVSRNGQSIAKKLLNIKVVRTDGSPVSIGRIIWLRNVVNSLISIVPLYGLVDALFIFGESRQCLHDKIAGTIVVKA